MKVFFLITLLLAVAVCTHGNEPVNDSAGNPVEIGKEYFIQPVKTESNNGGGLVPAAITSIPLCPLGIFQTIFPDLPGLPVSFALPYGGGPTVMTYLDVNIEFKSKFWPVCTEFSKFWDVDGSSSAQEEPAILIGGKSKSGDQNSTFEIEKAGDGAGANTYKLTTPYGTVGAKPSFYARAPQLIITHDAAKTLLVKFIKKVDVATTATTSTSRVEKLGLRMFPFY